MNLLISIPAFAKHGGIRILIELANRLSKWHNVTIYSLQGLHGIEYWNINEKVKVTDKIDFEGQDTLLIGSPHTIHLQDTFKGKIFIHLQMMEHLFSGNAKWKEECVKTYTSKHPLMSISEWNIEQLKNVYKRTAPTYYIGNGINYDEFPIDFKEKDFKTVLVEGWNAGNPSKDTENIAPKVALKLKREGYNIITYGREAPKYMSYVPEEVYISPDLKRLNSLYSRATILLKASKYDARSCSPMEAMTKGTVTARAIIKGDDDLINNVNCLKVGYSEQQLYKAAKTLLTNKEVYKSLQNGCKPALEYNNWDERIKEINNILTNG
jgi:hypothetical protein